MQQLIEQLTTQYKISEDDAIGIVKDIATYAEEKTQGLGSSLVNVINGTDEAAAEQTDTAAAAKTAAATETTSPVAEEGFFSKATHFVESHIPEGLTNGLKAKGEEMLEGVGTRLKGVFS